MPEMPPSRPAATRRIPIAIGAVVAVGVIGLGAFYGFGGFKRGAGGDPSCSGAVELARRDSATGAWRGGRADHGDGALAAPRSRF